MADANNVQWDNTVPTQEQQNVIDVVVVVKLMLVEQLVSCVDQVNIHLMMVNVKIVQPIPIHQTQEHVNAMHADQEVKLMDQDALVYFADQVSSLLVTVNVNNVIKIASVQISEQQAVNHAHAVAKSTLNIQDVIYVHLEHTQHKVVNVNDAHLEQYHLIVELASVCFADQEQNQTHSALCVTGVRLAPSQLVMALANIVNQTVTQPNMVQLNVKYVHAVVVSTTN